MKLGNHRKENLNKTQNIWTVLIHTNNHLIDGSIWEIANEHFTFNRKLDIVIINEIR